MQLLCIFLVFHAPALGLRRREGLASKGPVASAGGLPSTVGERTWTERLSPVITKREGFAPNNEVLPLPLGRGHLLLSGKMARPDPERSGLEDPDQYIRDQMPPWARWEENIVEDQTTGEEHTSEPCIWLNVTDSLRLCDENGVQSFGISEHGVRSGYTDILRLGDKVFTNSQRPYRVWEGCRFFSEVLSKGRAQARDRKLTVQAVEKRGGQTYSVTRKVLFACFNKDCRKKWDSGAQPWETAVSSFWSHLENASEQEEIEAREGGDRSVMTHPTREMMRQMTWFHDKQVKRDAELKLMLQGAALSPRADQTAKEHQWDYHGELPRTGAKQKDKGPAPRPPGSSSAQSQAGRQSGAKKKEPHPPSGPPRKKQAGRGSEDADMWEDVGVSQEILRSWNLLPGTSSRQTQKQRSDPPGPDSQGGPGCVSAANARVVQKKEQGRMAASSASVDSKASQGPKLPFFAGSGTRSSQRRGCKPAREIGAPETGTARNAGTTSSPGTPSAASAGRRSPWAAEMARPRARRTGTAKSASPR